MKIGFGIITKNRPEAFDNCYRSIVNYAPEGSIIAVVEDGSDNPYGWCNYYIMLRESKGISVAKNQAIEMLYDQNCTHFFIIEDDTIALCENWFMPYIESDQHHLCATFLPMSGKRGKIKTHVLGNGYCLYFTKHCIDTVGGFDTNFKNKYEHCELSRRINNAGLTPHKYMDVVGSEKLIYCLDQDKAIERSFTIDEMNDNLLKGFAHFNLTRNSKEFIPFR